MEIYESFSYNDRTTNNDVALLKLKERIDFKKFAGTVAPVCLPDLPRKYYDKTVTKSSYNKDLTTPGRSFCPRHLSNFQDDYTLDSDCPNHPSTSELRSTLQVTVAGWGLLTEGGKAPRKLHEVDLEVAFFDQV